MSRITYGIKLLTANISRTCTITCIVDIILSANCSMQYFSYSLKLALLKHIERNKQRNETNSVDNIYFVVPTKSFHLSVRPSQTLAYLRSICRIPYSTYTPVLRCSGYLKASILPWNKSLITYLPSLQIVRFRRVLPVDLVDPGERSKSTVHQPTKQKWW